MTQPTTDEVIDTYGRHRNRIIEACARAAHEVNRVYCGVLGDPVLGTWAEVDEEIRESARQGVMKALNGASAEQSHQSWLTFKAERGWTYGPVRNDVDKVHPCMVDYAMLPAAQKAKDTLYLATVRRMAEVLTQVLP